MTDIVERFRNGKCGNKNCDTCADLEADLAETEAELAALRGQLAEIIEVLRKELPSKKWGWSDE
jgi:hypothetical protein